jgi:type III secretion protein C
MIAANPTAVLTNAGSSLLARLQLLQSNGSAKILSRLPLLTMDNVGAVIDTAETFYVPIPAQQGQSITSAESVTPITVGATLRVTPHIVNEGAAKAVELFIDIEDSGVQNISFSSLPAIRRTTIGTQVVISENQSLLVGGFNSDQIMERKDYIPILGQLPLIGALFSKTANHQEKRERMFLITPRIIPSPLRQ